MKYKDKSFGCFELVLEKESLDQVLMTMAQASYTSALTTEEGRFKPYQTPTCEVDFSKFICSNAYKSFSGELLNMDSVNGRRCKTTVLSIGHDPVRIIFLADAFEKYRGNGSAKIYLNKVRAVLEGKNELL